MAGLTRQMSAAATAPLKTETSKDASVAKFKVDTKILAQLRKETQLPINKIKSALEATKNDYAAALARLEESGRTDGSLRAAKFAGRVAADGCVAVAVSPMKQHAALVEVRSRLKTWFMLLSSTSNKQLYRIDQLRNRLCLST